MSALLSDRFERALGGQPEGTDGRGADGARGGESGVQARGGALVDPPVTQGALRL